MNNANGEDFIAEGFHQLDDRLITKRPPKIVWPKEFRDQELQVQLTYMEKLANTMNHAAALIQDERNALNELLTKKEVQLVSMSKQLLANNELVQIEVTRMNKQKQGFHAEVSRLNIRIRELENGAVN